MKIIHEVEKCIGCGSCVAVCPFKLEMKDDSKAHLNGAQKDSSGTNEELETEDVSCIQDAADICPVQCIKIIKE
jgi:ferredoxin